MACEIERAPAGTAGGIAGFLRAGRWLRPLFAPFRRREVSLLDPRMLPEHVKRDLGFLDGRGVRYYGDVPR